MRENIEYHSPVPVGVGMAGIQRYAEEVGRILDVQDATGISDVAAALGGKIHFRGWDQIEDGTIYVHGKADFDICLPTFHSPTIRDRFTIAHEIAHYVLHAGYGKKPIVAMRSSSGRTEWEANWFAAALLMPHERFSSVWDALEGDAEKVASYFGVSNSAAEIRAKVLGLAPK